MTSSHQGTWSWTISRAAIAEGTRWDESKNEGLIAGALIVCTTVVLVAVAIVGAVYVSFGLKAAYAQSVKPKYPAEIRAASSRIAERNEDCRRQAREQHLHLLKRYLFMRGCKRKRAVSALRYTLF